MIKTAFRNLFRHKRRTLLTFSILSIAIMYYIVIQGMLDGFEIESTKNFINLETGHLKITSAEYNHETFEGRMSNYINVENALRSLPFINGICPRLKIVGFIDNGIDEYPVIIVGIDPHKDTTVFELHKYTNGLISPSGLWIGSVIANRFNVKEGDILYLTFKGKRGTIVSKEFTIEGIIDAPSFIINNLQVFTHINSLNEIGEFEGEISEIFVKTDNFENSFNYKTEVEKILPAYSVKTWQEEGKDFLSISEAKKFSQNILLFFIVLIGIIGTANTLMIAVFERIREIGTLKAIGMKDNEVMKLFITEGVLIGIAGSLFGVLLGVIINSILVKYGIDWSPLLPKEMNFGYRVSGVIKNTWNLKSIWISLILGPISTLIASYLPAKRAKSLLPAECLRWI
uniref:ABC transporter permease n=1 Tax=candidate division WOR-3 bacterium TaxID=2052148 RepID=A0A7V3ZYM7_UNCW3